ncbi:hypothetical protein B0H10DRAFT_1937749 [Mycena sp. CBHHK59/15]|nr:hypothetical protein B0H10DRAFT_1937749 [Mycena sp. CBHHK59/15]
MTGAGRTAGGNHPPNSDDGSAGAGGAAPWAHAAPPSAGVLGGDEEAASRGDEHVGSVLTKRPNWDDRSADAGSMAHSARAAPPSAEGSKSFGEAGRCPITMGSLGLVGYYIWAGLQWTTYWLTFAAFAAFGRRTAVASPIGPRSS